MNNSNAVAGKQHDRIPEKSISVIVPLHGDLGYARALLAFMETNSRQENLKELIFVSTQKSPALDALESPGKVRVVTFSGASYAACLEAGAFEATGQVVFFVAPGTFPEPNFDTTILTSLRKKTLSGILEKASGSRWLQKLKLMLPTRCVLCFMEPENFFTTRQLFHQKSKLIPQSPVASFSKLLHQYALAFRAQVV